MEVTKDLVLQSMNTYCTERKYGSETLIDGFKEKFTNFFVKKYEGKDVEDDVFKPDLHFNLDTAFNASVDLKNLLNADFTKKENDYKSQIDELNKKLGKKQTSIENPVIPKEVQDKLDELERYKNAEVKKTKFANIVELAKKSVRKDLHKSFETFANGIDVSLDKEDKEQAAAMVMRFQEIFKDSIGDIKPLAPQQTRKRDEEMLASIPKLKV